MTYPEVGAWRSERSTMIDEEPQLRLLTPIRVRYVEPCQPCPKVEFKLLQSE